MKPWHVALLVTGAALAGGLAVKMTQPQPVPDADWSAAPAAPAVQAAPVNAPPAPRPMTNKPDAAPPAVFTAPPAPAPRPAQNAIRKNKPNPFGEPVARNSPVKPFPSAVYVPEPAAPKSVPAPSPAPPASAAPPSGPQAGRRHVTLQPGMTLAVRVDGPLPGCAIPNETFSGSLAEPVIADHLVVAERGAPVSGKCNSRASRFQPQLVLSRLMTADGQWVAIATAPWTPGAGGVAPTRFQIASPVTITERDLGK